MCCILYVSVYYLKARSKLGCFAPLAGLYSIICTFLFQLANKYWAPHAKDKLPFDSKVS